MLDNKYHEKKFTKSAFNQAVECAMYAYYYRNSKDYAYHFDGVDGIAEVGDQFGALARVYEGVPDENIIRRDPTLSPVPAQMKTLVDTMRFLRMENADVAEAAFGTNVFLVYVDILHKRGDTLEIIEVKSKGIGADEPLYSFDGRGGRFKSDYLDKILDVTFQKYVVQQFTKFFESYSHLKVRAKLMLVNTDAISDVDSLSSLLQIKFKDGHREVECASDVREKLQSKNSIARVIDVDELCDKIINDEIPEIANEKFNGCFVDFVEKVADMYVNNRKDYSLCKVDVKKFNCPFYATDEERKAGKKDGRAEFFKDMLGVDIAGKPCIVDVKGGSKGLPPSLKGNGWLEQKKLLLTVINEYEYVPAEDATPEAFQKRTKLSDNDLRFLHVHSVKTGEVAPTFLKAAAKAEMAKWTYPLHFIDFETYQGAVPLFKGSRPNEEVAYQFSHHVCYEDGHYEHKEGRGGEFISLEAGKNPNFKFVRELKKQLDNDDGTIFRYAEHENIILNAIRVQLIESDESDKDELVRFIEKITHPTGSCKYPFTAGPRDMLDLKAVAQKYFYHPMMGSSNSIKQVFPAILASDETYFRDHYGDDMDPYHNLPMLKEFAAKVDANKFPADFDDSDIWNDEKQINCGGISKLDYVMLQAGRFNKLHTEAIRQASLKYCEVDTLAMVRIWEYFRKNCQE